MPNHELELTNKGRRALESMDIDIPVSLRVQFKDFISNIEILIWDRLSFGWYKGFEQLKQYVDEYGNSRVSSKHKGEDGFALGSWVLSRRTEYSKKKLDPDRIRQLELVPGWVWKVY